MSVNPPATIPRDPATAARRLARRRLWRRRLVKTGSWLVLMAMLTSMLVAVALLVVYHQRLQFTNQLLRLPDTPFEIQVGQIDGTRDGRFTARDLTVRLPGADPGSTLLHLPETTWKLHWRAAVAGEVEELVLRQPVLTIDASNWEALQGWLESDPGSAPATAPPGTRRRAAGLNLAPSAHRIRIDDGAVDLQLPGLPRIRARFDYQGDAIGILAGQAERLRTGRQTLTLREVQVEVPGVSGPLFAMPSADVAFQLQDRVLSVLDFQIHEPSVEATPADIEWLFSALQTWQDTPGPLVIEVPTPVTTPSAPVWIEAIEWHRIAIEGGQIRSGPGQVTLPELEPAVSLTMPRLATGLDLTLEDGRWSVTGGLLPGNLQASLVQFALSAALPGTGGLWVDQVSSGFRSTPSGEILIPHTRLLHPEITISREFLDSLTAWKALLPEPDPSAPKNSAGHWSIEGVEIVGGQLQVTGFGPELPDVKTGVSVDLPVWSMRSGDEGELPALVAGLHSDGVQRISLTDTEIRFGEADPLFVAELVEFEGVPDVMMDQRRIERLTMREPVWDLSPQNLPLLAGSPDEPEPPSQTGRPLWHGWTVGHLALTHARLETENLPGGLPDVRADFSITTAPSPEDDLPVHYLAMQRLEAQLTGVSDQPFARMQRATLRLRPDELWRDGNMGALDLLGARIHAGEGLRDHFAGDPGTTTEEPGADAAGVAEANPWLPEWHLQELILRESMLTISDIAPGLPDLPIALDLSTKNVPLTAGGMSRGTEPIKLELSTALRSPQDIRYVVADLRSVFVEFTLAGILRQEIDRVQVIAPTLNIGQHLFSYIDHYREMTLKAAAAAHAGTPPGPLPDLDDETMAPGGWNIRRIEIESGQLVVAPKGVALFPNPFPFSAVTELSDGRINASFVVPKDDYDFDQLDLHLEGLSGEVLFNLPVAGEDNNLVEVLRSDRIRWKGFEVTDAYLSISYDRFGIYIGLGGNAYEGYANGEFNIYLEHLYNWDGWVALTGVNMFGLTEILSPEYFLMNGAVDMNLIAQGNLEELFEAFGELTTTTPGTIHITQLDGLIDNLPDEWSSLKREIIRLGVEPLRWFEYEDGKGSFELRRLGGVISLALEGPRGVRGFDVELHGQPLSMFIAPVVPGQFSLDLDTTATPSE